MLTLVGKDRPGIVARLTGELHRGNCNLGEASMTRLGGNFTIMLMVQFEGVTASLERIIAPVCDSLGLKCHVDLIEGELHRHLEPDVRISVHGADRAGIVSEVTHALAEAGLNILNLESDVGGTEQHPIYIMQIEGIASRGTDIVREALDILAREKDVDTELSEIEIFRG